MSKIKVDDWTGCYPSKWKGIIVDDAMRHPAEFSSRLIRRIYEHMIAEGWLKPGDMVIDPFGGVALGALDAMRTGIAWRGVELEANFVALGNQNIASWNSRFSNMPRWNPDALLLQGDSRNLLQILGDAGHKAAVSSPPYAETPVVSFTDDKERTQEILRQLKEKGYIEWEGKQYTEAEWRAMNHGRIDGRTTKGAKKGATGYSQAAVSSPPYAESIGNAEQSGIDWGKQADRETDHPHGWNGAGYSQAAISSPPYADGCAHTGGNDKHPEHVKGGIINLPGIAGATSSPPYVDSIETKGGIGPKKSKHKGGPHSQMMNSDTRYSSIAGSVSSPPYTGEALGHAGGEVPRTTNAPHSKKGTPNSQNYSFVEGEGYGSTPGQLGAMKGNGFEAAISSPPFQAAQTGGGIAKFGYSNEEMRKGSGEQPFDLVGKRAYMPENQGTHVGNLANMPAGDFNAAITSPPFRQASGGTPEPKEGGTIDNALYARHAAGNASAEAYGQEEGQLANMPEGDFEAAVSSPPYEGAIANRQHEGTPEKYFERQKRYNESHPEYKRPSADSMWYGGTEGQLAAEYGNDFWAAARAIVEQVFLALAPGGHAVWVLKAFVRNKEIVDFPDQWRQLCEAVGFVSLHEHHALLVRHTGTSLTLEGGKVEHKTESKSFFRRLAEKNGSPRIDYEVVLCQEKPV